MIEVEKCIANTDFMKLKHWDNLTQDYDNEVIASSEGFLEGDIQDFYPSYKLDNN